MLLMFSRFYCLVYWTCERFQFVIWFFKEHLRCYVRECKILIKGNMKSKRNKITKYWSAWTPIKNGNGDHVFRIVSVFRSSMRIPDVNKLNTPSTYVRDNKQCSINLLYLFTLVLSYSGLWNVYLLALKLGFVCVYNKVLVLCLSCRQWEYPCCLVFEYPTLRR